MNKRLTFSAFVDKAFWALLLGIVSYGVKFLGDMSGSVQELNSKMEVVVYENRLHDYGLKDHERRITELEKEVIHEKDHAVRAATSRMPQR